MEPRIGLKPEQREAVVGMLEGELSDVITLYFETRGAHWNVVGPHFGALHKFFQEQYEQLDEEMDEIAERIRTLGERAPSKVAHYAKATRLTENAGDARKWDEMIRNLLDSHEQIIRQFRKDIEVCEANNDQGSADFVTGLMEAHEKMAWMLRVHLE